MVRLAPEYIAIDGKTRIAGVAGLSLSQAVRDEGVQRNGGWNRFIAVRFERHGIELVAYAIRNGEFRVHFPGVAKIRLGLVVAVGSRAAAALGLCDEFVVEDVIG